MFTGIIQNLGKVQSIRISRGTARLAFQFKKREKNTRRGESIAVNGVCLTAAKISASGFEADLVQETLAATNLGQLKAGDWVNLERSLRMGDAIGGHFVTGHVDAMGQIGEIKRRGGNWSLFVHTPKTIISRLAVKGSLACDGISLTVQALEKRGCWLAVIPHTLAVTTLGRKKKGDFLNLEIDMLIRYLERLKVPASKKISVRSLLTQGF